MLPTISFADNHHLFPSDILDQAEKESYKQERTERYLTERQWSYPGKFDDNMRQNSDTSYYPDTNQYITIDGKPVSDSTSPQYDSSQYPISDHHKYGGLNSNTTPNYHSTTDTMGTVSERQQPYDPAFNQTGQSKYPPALKYPGQAITYPQNNYGTQGYNRNKPAGSVYDTNYGKSHSNLLFPSDVESSKQQNKKRFEPFANQFNKQQEINQPKETIRYVPVPVYNVPGTLPGTVPGMVTPSNMVPGYSHLNPYNSNPGFGSFPFNNYGTNNLWGGQYNPFSPFGTMPGIGNPFSSFYNSDYNSFNSMPFAYPGYMMPGLSSPDMFSKPGAYKIP